MITYKIYSCGKFIATKSKLEVTNKYTLKRYATTYQANEKELNAAISHSLKIKQKCAQLSVSKKVEALEFIAAEILKNKKHLAKILCTESAKPMIYALAEIERAANVFNISATECKKSNTEIIAFNKTAYGTVNYFPIGIVGGISPFNFPLNLAVHKIAPAIAAGCPIILKPASLTPLSTLELAKIIHRSKLPKGMVTILPMDRVTGNILVTHPKINLLTFTGSPDVGWKLKEQCGKKKIVLELGGNAATIISEHTNLNDCIAKSVYGAYAYSGQICIHAQRFYVHKKHFSSFVKKMKEETLKLKFGNPLNIKTKISNVIDEANANRIEAWLDESLKQGAKLICGGKRKGNFVEPTILTNTTAKMKVNAEEVFGPVICIEFYEGKIDNAIKLVNSSKFGLQCGIFTNNKIELEKCYKLIEVGGIIHNNVPTVRFDAMPYGGVKESGLGREGVKYAIQDMLEAKVLVQDMI